MKKTNAKKLLVTSWLLVLSLIVLAASVSYAYFTLTIKGQAKTPEASAGNLNVTSTLENTSIINATSMQLIEKENVDTEAQKVEFSVTNNGTSTLNAKYTVKLVNMSMTKNLSSKYFKWKLVVNPSGDKKEYTGDFSNVAGSEQSSDGDVNRDQVTGLEKTLIDEKSALPLNISATDSLVFYVWLENDPLVNQIYLTSGNFSGKLSIVASPSN